MQRINSEERFKTNLFRVFCERFVLSVAKIYINFIACDTCIAHVCFSALHFFARYSRRRIKDKIYVALKLNVGIRVLAFSLVLFFGGLKTENCLLKKLKFQRAMTEKEDQIFLKIILNCRL